MRFIKLLPANAPRDEWVLVAKVDLFTCQNIQSCTKHQLAWLSLQTKKALEKKGCWICEAFKNSLKQIPSRDLNPLRSNLGVLFKYGGAEEGLLRQCH